MHQLVRLSRIALVAGAALAAASLPAFAQEGVTYGAPISVGPDTNSESGPGVDEASWGSQPGEAPEGIEPLPVDLFTSTDFYQDTQYYTDQRYYRCMDTDVIEYLWENNVMDTFTLENLPWGNCNSGATLEQLVSPYAFTSAADHWAAIIKDVESRGGPTKYTPADLPDWSGVWTRVYQNRVRTTDVTGPGGDPQPVEQLYPYWMWTAVQASTLASVLTPEYQKRMVQDVYHDVHNRAQNWPLTYCQPEGYLRWYTGTIDPIFLFNTPEAMTFLGQGVGSSVRVIFNDRQFDTSESIPKMNAAAPKWYGDSIGMWDGDKYYVWTSNVQAWTQHQSFDFSGQMQSIEIYSPEQRAEDGALWLKHETIFYDSEALTKPLRVIMSWKRLNDKLNEGRAYTFSECLQTIFPMEGRPAQVTPGTTIEYTVPDYFDRPWARLNEKYFEKDMNPPEAANAFGAFN